MKFFPRLVLTILIPAVLSAAVFGGPVHQGSIPVPLPDSVTIDAVGAGAWGDFFSGVACGAGIALAVSGYLSGVAAPAALAMTAGIVSTCARALKM
jgi:hypothetical protein